MAVYSRAQNNAVPSNNTQNTQTTSPIPSQDISNLIVKSLYNVLNESNDENDIENNITNGINNSDVIKDENRDKDSNSNKDDEIIGLLKNNQNTKTPSLQSSNNSNEKNNTVSANEDKSRDTTPISNTLQLINENTENRDEALISLLKDKDNKNDNKALISLLKDKNVDKDKKNDNEALVSLLKDKNTDKDKKNDKDKNTDKDKNSIGKILGIGTIGATIGAIIKSKSLGQATGTVVSGAGKVAGGLVSGVGSLGGGVIAGIGKLFGPVGGIIGKVVGTAVATPFKLVGGVITKAISGLGTLLSMPLKEMVTKAGLILAVGSQLFVFLEGLIARFKADSDLRAIDFAAKIKSYIGVIPEKIKLSLEQVLSKVRIMGQPIFGSLSKDEKKELKSLEKDKDLKQYRDALSDLEKKQKQRENLKNVIETEAAGAGFDFDVSQFDLSSEEGRQSLKDAFMANVPENNKGYYTETIDKLLKDYKLKDLDVQGQESYVNFLETQGPDKEKIQRYKELDDLSKTERTKEWYNEQIAAIDTEQQEKYEDYVQQGLKKEVEKGDLTAYEAERAKDKFGWGTQVNTVLSDYKTEHQGESYNFAPATAAEKFLDNQYKSWTNAWKDMLSHTLQNTVGVNVNFNQETEKSNPV